MNTDNDVQTWPGQRWPSVEIVRQDCQDCITRSRYWQSVFVRLPCNLEIGHSTHTQCTVMVHRNRTITESLKCHPRKQSSSARNFTNPSFLTRPGASYNYIISCCTLSVLQWDSRYPLKLHPWLNLNQHYNHIHITSTILFVILIIMGIMM